MRWGQKRRKILNSPLSVYRCGHGYCDNFLEISKKSQNSAHYIYLYRVFYNIRAGLNSASKNMKKRILEDKNSGNHFYLNNFVNSYQAALPILIYFNNKEIKMYLTKFCFQISLRKFYRKRVRQKFSLFFFKGISRIRIEKYIKKRMYK